MNQKEFIKSRMNGYSTSDSLAREVAEVLVNEHNWTSMEIALECCKENIDKIDKLYQRGWDLEHVAKEFDRLEGYSKTKTYSSNSHYADAKVILDKIYKTLKDKLPNCKVERDVGNEPVYNDPNFDRDLGIGFDEEYGEYVANILVTLPDGNQSPINVYFSSGIDKVVIAGIENDYNSIDEYVNAVNTNPSSVCYSKTNTYSDSIESLKSKLIEAYAPVYEGDTDGFEMLKKSINESDVDFLKKTLDSEISNWDGDKDPIVQKAVDVSKEVRAKLNQLT